MADILLKNIPPHLHQALRERAKQEHRSLNKEVISLLAKAIDHFPTEHPEGHPKSFPAKATPTAADPSPKKQEPRRSIQDDLPPHLL
ncbi:MAG: hypothetical protein LAT55_06820 [Opitutales bacterium]|nr:hypothetical protein [Opitutales bacterium]